MSIDTTQRALDALKDQESMPSTMPETYVLGYRRGWDDALALAIRIEQAINNRDDLFSDRILS